MAGTPTFFHTTFNTRLQYSQMYLERIPAFVFGLMLSSSAVLPVLCSNKLNLESLAKFDFGIFAICTLFFVYWNQEKIIQNGPMVIVFCFFGGILILLSVPNSMEELPPYIPLGIVTGLLMTVSTVPWLRETFLNENRPTLHNFISATRGRSPARSAEGTIAPSSVHSNDTSYGNTNQPFSTDPQDLAHIGYATQSFPISDRGYRATDLDVELGYYHQLETNSEPGESEAS